MNNQLTKREQLDEIAARIDAVADEATELMALPERSFARELKVARAMHDLRELMTPEVMAPILAVMNTDLGFRTDKDPRQINKDTGRPNVPYESNVVRDCWIEARLRGFRTLGNEFNIIAGRCYPAKSGFRRKLTDGKTFPGLSGFRDSYEVPKLVGDKGAIVKCKATWTLNGKPDSFDAEFAIRVNSMMGSDAILGKAQKKLCQRVHDILSGQPSPEAELDDALDGAKPAQAEVVTPEPTAPTKPDSKPEPKRAGDPVGDLMACVLDGGHTFDDFRLWAAEMGHIADAESIAQFSDVPKDVAARLLRAKTGMLNQLASRKAAQ